MERDCELEKLVVEQQELCEQIKGRPGDLDLRFQLADLIQRIKAIEHDFSMTALLFARRH